MSQTSKEFWSHFYCWSNYRLLELSQSKWNICLKEIIFLTWWLLVFFLGAVFWAVNLCQSIIECPILFSRLHSIIYAHGNSQWVINTAGKRCTIEIVWRSGDTCRISVKRLPTEQCNFSRQKVRWSITRRICSMWAINLDKF